MSLGTYILSELKIFKLKGNLVICKIQIAQIKMIKANCTKQIHNLKDSVPQSVQDPVFFSRWELELQLLIAKQFQFQIQFQIRFQIHFQIEFQMQ